MKETQHEHPATVEHPHGCGCARCAPPALCRNNYFKGKLLTERDFKDEQRYFLDRFRRHDLALHGWGVVCGLKVKPHPHCPHLKVIVEPGLAIDRCGREIVVPHEVEIDIPGAKPPPEPEKKCPPEEAKQPAAPLVAAPAENAEQKEQWTKGEPVKTEPTPEQCPADAKLARFYLCIRYAEDFTEKMPAPFDECGCSTATQQPSRICQSYELKLFEREPDAFKEALGIKDRCDSGDCADLFKVALKGCPAWSSADCLPLAVIHHFVIGNPIREEHIDNETYRVQVPSTAVLYDVIQCILKKLPTRKLTHIDCRNWEHGGNYECCNFIERFVKSRQGFRVEFDGPLRPDCWSDPRVFQATIVHYPMPGRPGHSEIAPATVVADPDCKALQLMIDECYGAMLEHKCFDVFLTLRCNFLLDENGLAVDGTLLAKAGPGQTWLIPQTTGEGIPGGTFESWIGVNGPHKQNP